MSRRRGIGAALLSAGQLDGPVIIRAGKVISATDKHRASDASKAIAVPPTALSDALMAAGLVPAQIKRPKSAEGRPKPQKPHRSNPEPTLPAPTSSKAAKQPGKAKAAKAQGKGRAKPKKDRSQSPSKAQRRAERWRNEAVAGHAETRRLLVQEIAEGKLRFIEGFLKDVEFATFAELCSTWQKHVTALEYIRSSGHNAERIPAYERLLLAIEQEWQRRSKLDRSERDYFDWPTTDAKRGKGSLLPHEWASEGVLAYLGYHVGEKAGINQNGRWAILRRVFSGHLPPIESTAYMASWGQPASPARLKKLAESIASFARSAKRRSSINLSVAIADWENDLSMLYHEYYVDKFKFGWPKT